MEKCEWKYDADESENHYQTECGGDWFFFEGTRKDNQMILCPFCGELIYELESIAQKDKLVLLNSQESLLFFNFF